MEFCKRLLKKSFICYTISYERFFGKEKTMDNIVNMGQNDVMSNFTKTDDIMNDMRKIIEGSQKTAHQAVNTILVQRNWLIGYRIASEELNGEDRADYGAEVIKKLSFELTKEFGKGYTKSNLYSFYSFYKICNLVVLVTLQRLITSERQGCP